MSERQPSAPEEGPHQITKEDVIMALKESGDMMPLHAWYQQEVDRRGNESPRTHIDVTVEMAELQKEAEQYKDAVETLKAARDDANMLRDFEYVKKLEEKITEWTGN